MTMTKIKISKHLFTPYVVSVINLKDGRNPLSDVSLHTENIHTTDYG